MERSRAHTIVRLTVFIAIAMTALAPSAFAADPVAYNNCAWSYKPYKVYSSSAAIYVMRAKSEIACFERFQNCLERSSWTGYRTVRCNAWASVDVVKRSGWGSSPVLTTREVSGCVKGTYDYHTKTTYVSQTGSTRVLTSEAYKGFYCSKDV